MKKLLLLAGLALAAVMTISAGDFPSPPCTPSCYFTR
jgi:hypothetical protein